VRYEKYLTTPVHFVMRMHTREKEGRERRVGKRERGGRERETGYHFDA
jgi:hypothetical protein